MKGVIFNVLEEMVVQQCGIQVWNEVLDETGDVDGIYTSGDSYPDEELFALVETVCAKLDQPMATVVQAFGVFLFDQLAARYPIFVENEDNLRDFLKSVESVIHIEVKKLYDSPNLPNFTYDESDADTLLMQYRSPRKLCILAEGLIRGAAAYYDTEIEIGHDVCMHKGADHCDLKVRFLDGQNNKSL